MIGMTEADTCRKTVLPKLVAAGWDTEPHSFTQQPTFTDGWIIVAGGKVRRCKQKRANYLLRYTRDFPIAVRYSPRSAVVLINYGFNVDIIGRSTLYDPITIMIDSDLI